MSTRGPRTSKPRAKPSGTDEVRAAILTAAGRHFARHGTAASLREIATDAQVNLGLIHRHFGNKDDLFREILGRKLGERMAWATAAPADPAEGLAYWLDIACRDTDWVRLMQWEALEAGTSEVAREAERQRASRWATDEMRRRQAQGLVAPDLDPAQMLLSMVALTTFPVAFPQITRLVTGCTPTGWFRPSIPLRNTVIRSDRWIPSFDGFESGTVGNAPG